MRAEIAVNTAYHNERERERERDLKLNDFFLNFNNFSEHKC